VAHQLAPEDDELGHTTPFPLGSSHGPPSRDPRAFERHWNVLHDDTGDLLLAIGGSAYPVLGRAEAYAVVVLRGDHRSVRAMRPLTGDPLACGPLTSTVVEGLRRWRHRVTDGPWGFSYDLAWTDTHTQAYGAAWGPEVEHGERQVTAGFEGFGTVTGWVEVDGERVEWGPGDAHGTRDRHWGVGRGVGGPALNGGRVHRPGWKGGMWIDLGDVAVWGRVLLRPLGDLRPPGRVTGVRRRLRFEEGTQVFTEGLVELDLDDGTTREMHLERLGAQTAFMRCGFYGGTPGTDVHHGGHDGPLRVEHDRFDVTDPAARLALRGLDEHHCRVSWEGGSTTGVLQPVEPDAYEACVAGDRGWALW
jgi:hypothetical protein